MYYLFIYLFIKSWILSGESLWSDHGLGFLPKSLLGFDLFIYLFIKSWILSGESLQSDHSLGSLPKLLLGFYLFILFIYLFIY